MQHSVKGRKTTGGKENGMAEQDEVELDPDSCTK
jgi:hypothetical protein